MVERVAETRLVANRDSAPRRGLDGRLDDVALPVPLARRNVARQHEIRQRGQRHVVRSPHARLQHPAAPHRNPRGLSHIVHAFGLAEPRHAPQLDVDDAASAQPDGLLRVVSRADAFVQADVRLEPSLQLGVVDDVVVAERLLDHHQVVVVELAKMFRIGQRVSRVGVRHQLDSGKTLSHPPHHIHVPARLDLDLDALVPRGQLALDLLQKLLDRVLNPNRDAAGNLAPRTAADLLPQRHPVEARLQVPHRRFQAPTRHVVAADVRRQRVHLRGAVDRAAQHARRRVVAQDHPRRPGPLLVVERAFAGRHFAPAGHALALHFHQDDVALGGAPETGFEEMHQRHFDLSQGDAFNSHGHGSKR